MHTLIDVRKNGQRFYMGRVQEPLEAVTAYFDKEGILYENEGKDMMGAGLVCIYGIRR